jgi:hypothetical protein
MSHVLEKLVETVHSLAHLPSTPALYEAESEAIPLIEPKFVVLEGVKITLTMDKSAWPDGPWKNEPDELEWHDQVTGYKCLVRRHPAIGTLCGYVGVPEGHTLYGMTCRDRVEQLRKDVELSEHASLIDVFLESLSGEPDGTVPISLALKSHGNTNFADKFAGHDEWFFGFDTSHTDDMAFMPNWKMYESMGITFSVDMWKKLPYRDVYYVVEQVTGLAEQLLRRE